LAAIALLFAAYFATAFYSAVAVAPWGQRAVVIAANRGQFSFHMQPAAVAGFSTSAWRRPEAPNIDLRWRYHPAGWISAGASAYIAIPIWSFLIVPTGFVIVCTLAQRGPLSRACCSCHYDLSGLPPGSPCPECASPRSTDTD
jgi:hypothetical protein